MITVNRFVPCFKLQNRIFITPLNENKQYSLQQAPPIIILKEIQQLKRFNCRRKIAGNSEQTKNAEKHTHFEQKKHGIQTSKN